MLTIITPCSRPENLPKLFNSINFDKIDKWIIVYDTSKNRNYNKIFLNYPKISEYEKDGGISGNPQRNYAIDLINDGWVYFLDDDNIIHPDFWSVLDNLDENYYYTFDMQRSDGVFKGKYIKINWIDTAMYLLHRKHIGDIRWKNELYNADGHFICEVFNNYKNGHKYIEKTCSYYNYLR